MVSSCMLVECSSLKCPSHTLCCLMQKLASEGSPIKSSPLSQSKMETPSASSSDLFSAHDFDIHIELPSANKCEQLAQVIRAQGCRRMCVWLH